MVEGRGIVGIELTPETNLARRIIDKYSLSPPVDIRSMVEAYARLTFVHIPFDDIDGVSLNLKTRDTSTHVIVNSASAPSRQRFTMAHELGHILIPWHVGSVLIDQVAPVSPRSSSYFTPESWTMETEANSFAAELLMPYSWLERVVQPQMIFRRFTETSHNPVRHPPCQPLFACRNFSQRESSMRPSEMEWWNSLVQLKEPLRAHWERTRSSR